MRLVIGLTLVLLSLPSFAAGAVRWEFHGIDSRVEGVALAALGCWAAYGGVRGLLRVRSAKASLTSHHKPA